MYQEWHSADGRFGVAINQEGVRQLVRKCIKARGCETGGVLIGYYAGGLALAIITNITGPPRDSRAGRTFFLRGTRGLQHLLDRLWQRKAGYYMGEWHFHPEGDGSPSGVDLDQMEQIANSLDYQCPEPILLIVTLQNGGAWRVRAFVYPAGQQIELTKIQTS